MTLPEDTWPLEPGVALGDAGLTTMLELAGIVDVIKLELLLAVLFDIVRLVCGLLVGVSEVTTGGTVLDGATEELCNKLELVATGPVGVEDGSPREVSTGDEFPPPGVPAPPVVRADGVINLVVEPPSVTDGVV